MAKRTKKEKIDESNDTTEVVEPIIDSDTEEEAKQLKERYAGKIMVKKSPIFRPHKGVTIQSVPHMDENEIVAVNPNDKRVQIMLKNGNLQFVSNQVRKTPTGDYPRIMEE